MEQNVERVARFLQEAGTYYLATTEGDQPRVRPFGTAQLFEGKLYIQTGKSSRCPIRSGQPQGGNLRLYERGVDSCGRGAGRG